MELMVHPEKQWGTERPYTNGAMYSLVISVQPTRTMEKRHRWLQEMDSMVTRP